MRLVDDLLKLSATDLANHLSCARLSELDFAAAEGRARKPRWRDPLAALLAERGLEHEKAYLEHLRAAGDLAVEQIGADRGAAATAAAMRAGVDLIYQAPLGNERWFGRADFLRRCAVPSALGEWSYEVIDAKLATQTRAGTILQLCVYSELVANLQGIAPAHAHVVAPHHDFEPEHYRLADFAAYYRLVKTRLEAAIAASPPRTSYPEPVQHCEVCAWWSRCDAERRRDDHLCFVAGLSRLQIKELARIDVTTLERLGELDTVRKPARGSREALVRARDQAAIQLKARRLGRPQHEVLMPLGPEHGLARLPRPSQFDVFLDLEGDRLAIDGGREYLFGLIAAPLSDPSAGAAPRGYRAIWAATPEEEKRAFEAVVDLILATFRARPDMHVYHFGAYEPATFKRLSGRYATRETELDTLLRGEVFVDLYTIVRHSLKASVESYSIKELEQFYGLERRQDLRAATASRHAVEWAIEMHERLGVGTHAATEPQLALAFDAQPAPSAELAAHVAAVELYNREDCLSAESLRAWLETLRSEAEREHGVELPRPEQKSGEASEQIAATADETARVFAELTANVPMDVADRTPEQQARWLLAHLLEWHRREDKAAWWEYFRLRDLPLEDYEDERSALAGLALLDTVGGTGARPIRRYSFPPQDHDVRRDDDACLPQDGLTLGPIVAIDVGRAHARHSARRPGSRRSGRSGSS